MSTLLDFHAHYVGCIVRGQDRNGQYKMTLFYWYVVCPLCTIHHDAPIIGFLMCVTNPEEEKTT